MFTLRGRLACGSVALVLGAVLLAAGQPVGWLFVGQVALLAYGYARYGPVALAFQAYHRQDWARLAALLGEVRRPEWLRPQDRAYFEFLRGVLAMCHGDVGSARRHLAAADAARLRTDHIRCVLECHRADAALAAGERAAAAAHLAAARAIPHRPEVEPEIARLELAVATG